MIEYYDLLSEAADRLCPRYSGEMASIAEQAWKNGFTGGNEPPPFLQCFQHYYDSGKAERIRYVAESGPFTRGAKS